MPRVTRTPRTAPTWTMPICCRTYSISTRAGSTSNSRVSRIARACWESSYVAVTDPINPSVETPEQVRNRVLEAAEYIPVNRLGTTDDCGFAPFGDDTSTARETAFQKIRARVMGTELAAQQLGVI